jgi:hypothetical protein
MRARHKETPQVYSYDPISDAMRIQAYFILNQLVEDTKTLYEFWGNVERNIKLERGKIEIGYGGVYAEENVLSYLQEETKTEYVLDLIEMAFRQVQHEIDASASIRELNMRFRRHNLGYEFVGNPGVLIRVHSEYVHSEIVEPAIALLHAAGHEGPLDEFMKAHQEYRRGDYKDAMNDANKAFESTMKAICQENNWNCEPGWNAKQLVKAMISNGLLHPSLESYFNGIQTILTSGVPTIRNKQSGHGQGALITNVPDYFAAFALHLTAANILLLMSAKEYSN